jgi:hypothetical protein
VAELLVFAGNRVHPDPEVDRVGSYKKGDIIHVAPDSWQWGLKEGPPDFVIVKVPGVSLAAAKQYMDEWRVSVSFSVVGSDPAVDGFRLALVNDTVSATGKSAITRAQVEAFLNDWNATVVNVQSNRVVFDVLIFAALTSVGFWGEFARIGAANVVGFTEQSYDQASGVHIIAADYSDFPTKGKAVEAAIAAKGGALVSHDTENKIVVYQMTRADARAEFERDVYAKLHRVYKRRRFAFSEADVDAALLAGGVVTLTAQQAQAALIDGMTS